jgi:hypothetical protein
VLGPAGSVDQALDIFEKAGCEAAILDVNLGRETAEPIAIRLARSSIPFVTISGYTRDQLPTGVNPAPLLGKPLNSALVIETLKRCLAASPQS